MIDLLAIGGAHIDRRARLLGPHRPGTSNPVSVDEEIGGGAFNAARSARRFGLAVGLASVRGGDAAGARVAQAVAEAGLSDLSANHLDRTTPSYTALLTTDGELVTAMADMALYETGFERSIRRGTVTAALGDARAVLIDANLPGPALARVLARCSTKPVSAVAVSAAKAPRLAPHLAALATLFMNRYEAAALTGLPGSAPMSAHAAQLRSAGLARGVITAGATPALFFDGDTEFQLAPPTVSVADVIGAGDALAGTMAGAIASGRPFREAARLGMAAAALTAARAGAAPAIALAEIEALAQTVRDA